MQGSNYNDQRLAKSLLEANATNVKLRQEKNELVKENKDLKAKIQDLEKQLEVASVPPPKRTKKTSATKEEDKNDTSDVSSNQS